jgi:hypothetical protein
VISAAGESCGKEQGRFLDGRDCRCPAIRSSYEPESLRATAVALPRRTGLAAIQSTHRSKGPKALRSDGRSSAVDDIVRQPWNAIRTAPQRQVASITMAYSLLMSTGKRV